MNAKAKATPREAQAYGYLDQARNALGSAQKHIETTDHDRVKDALTIARTWINSAEKALELAQGQETEPPRSCPYNVGDGANYNIGSDTYPVTVRKVSPTGHRVETTADRIRLGGMFEPCEKGIVRIFTRRRDGTYRMVGGKHGFLNPGRVHHMDPGF